MFQVTRRVDYAIRIMIELAQLEPGDNLSARELSKKTAVPKAFLHKINSDLLKASLTRTYAGAHGGVALAKSAKDISVLQVVEAVEGTFCINSCLIHPQECPRDMICPGHAVWGRVQNMLVQELSSISFDELANSAQILKENPQRPAHIVYVSEK
ncbi:MAG: Rrf2 family transcriptional regulator [Chloroflexi bacterium]|nr:MAG: Rrf2 family transcriptional regulator [Chloroflexota bacterium]PIE80900.1 MAG: Rrf2 family transcriptional regulator [Chloroflexota bacterium]